ncbi:MAG: adenosylmethionine--8-amino-7-oxononanoate transaminase [bacterium]
MHLWHPYTRFSTFAHEPLPMIVRGEGIHLIDDQGHRYVDAISSWWCCALGHGHPKIVEAIQRQAAELQHSILGNLSHPHAVELASRLAALMPDPHRHVLFASDGSSAVEQALKIAVQYFHNIGRPERKRFACLADGYHGDTFGAMSMGYIETFHKPFQPLLIPADRLPFPGGPAGAGPSGGTSSRSSAFEDALRILDPHAHEYAAVIVEPLVQGAAGMRMYGADWLKKLADWCKANGVLLIVDEIATGFGRTGTLFALEQAGIDPDIVCVGKALSAGYLPISATIVKDTIYATFGDQPVDHTLQHGHTFSGNPICAAAALAALDVYTAPDFLPEVRRKSSLLASTRDTRHPPRILGLIAAVELGNIGHARLVRESLVACGVLLRPLGNVVYIMPPLIISDNELTVLAQEVATAILETTECAD